ncbi:uncharacterized protein LOC106470165 isoform X25 [Limulus polyphemus]|uniref:Uncharacterized protein LOC106470165 isoform X25 n=1 Tax=Limulus polyphemus TaxID=6850 RepID=A0ABM1TF23_LIMPO|nr:uncharacterized protein LOC106470165 isoform X25 [Limulus polyphemus]
MSSEDNVLTGNSKELLGTPVINEKATSSEDNFFIIHSKELLDTPRMDRNITSFQDIVLTEHSEEMLGTSATDKYIASSEDNAFLKHNKELLGTPAIDKNITSSDDNVFTEHSEELMRTPSINEKAMSSEDNVPGEHSEELLHVPTTDEEITYAEDNAVTVQIKEPIGTPATDKNIMFTEDNTITECNKELLVTYATDKHIMFTEDNGPSEHSNKISDDSAIDESIPSCEDNAFNEHSEEVLNILSTNENIMSFMDNELTEHSKETLASITSSAYDNVTSFESNFPTGNISKLLPTMKKSGSIEAYNNDIVIEQAQRSSTTSEHLGSYEVDVNVASEVDLKVVPQLDVNVVPEASVLAVPELNVNTIHKEDENVPSEVGLNVVRELDVNLTDEVKMNVVSDEDVNVAPEVNMNVAPEVNLNVVSELDVNEVSEEDTNLVHEKGANVTFEDSANIVHVVDINLVPEEDVNVHRTISVNAVPELDVNILQARDINVASEIHVNAVPEAHVNVAPEANVSVVAEVGINKSPEVEMNLVHDVDINVVPEVDMNVVPELDVNAVPEEDVNVATEDDMNIVDELDVNEVPEASVEKTSEVDVYVVPEVDVNEVPEASVEKTSKVDVHVVPEVDVNVATEDVMNIVDDVDDNVVPEASVDKTSEVDVYVVPEVDVNVATEDEIDVSKVLKLDENVIPEVGVNEVLGVSLNVVPKVDLNVGSEYEVNIVREADVNVAPEGGLNEVYDVNVYEIPEKDMVVAAEVGLNTILEADGYVASDVDVTEVPEVEVNEVSKVDTSLVPEVDVSSEIDVNVDPEVDVNVAYLVGVNITPEVDVDAHSGINMNIFPKVDLNVASEVEMNVVSHENKVLILHTGESFTPFTIEENANSSKYCAPKKHEEPLDSLCADINTNSSDDTASMRHVEGILATYSSDDIATCYNDDEYGVISKDGVSSLNPSTVKDNDISYENTAVAENEESEPTSLFKKSFTADENDVLTKQNEEHDISCLTENATIPLTVCEVYANYFQNFASEEPSTNDENANGYEDIKLFDKPLGSSQTDDRVACYVDVGPMNTNVVDARVIPDKNGVLREHNGQILATSGCENNHIIKEGRSEAVSEISETKNSCEEYDLTKQSERALGIFTTDDIETSNEHIAFEENTKENKKKLEEPLTLFKMQENELSQNNNSDESNVITEESSQPGDIPEIVESFISTENKVLVKNIKEPLKSFILDGNVFSYEDTLLPEQTEKQLPIPLEEDISNCKNQDFIEGLPFSSVEEDFTCCKNQDSTEHIEEELSFSSVREPDEDSTFYKIQDPTKHIEEELSFSSVREPEEDSTFYKIQDPTKHIEEDFIFYKSQDPTKHIEEELSFSSVREPEEDSTFYKIQDPTEHIEEELPFSSVREPEEDCTFYKSKDPIEHIEEELPFSSVREPEEDSTFYKSQDSTEHIEEELPVSSVEENFNYYKNHDSTERINEEVRVSSVEEDLNIYNHQDSTEYIDEKLYTSSADEGFSNRKNQYLTEYIYDEEDFSFCKSRGFTEQVDVEPTVKSVEEESHIDLSSPNFSTDDNKICFGDNAVTDAIEEHSCSSIFNQNIKSFDDKFNEKQFEQPSFTFGIGDITASCENVIFSDQIQERGHEFQVNENVISYEDHLVEQNESQLHLLEEYKNHISNNSGVLTNQAENPVVTTGVEKDVIFSDHGTPRETVTTIMQTVDDISGQHTFKQADQCSVSKYESFRKELETYFHTEATNSERLGFALVDEDLDSSEHKFIEIEHSCEPKKDAPSPRDTVETTTEKFITSVVENIVTQAIHIAQANENVTKRTETIKPPNICVRVDEVVSYSCENEHLETSRCLSPVTSPDKQNTRLCSPENELYLGCNIAEESPNIPFEEERNSLCEIKEIPSNMKEVTLPFLVAEQTALPESKAFQNQQEARQTKEASNQIELENIQEVWRELEEVLERLKKTEIKLAEIHLMESEYDDELISHMYRKYMDIHQDLEKYESMMHRAQQNIILLTDEYNTLKTSNIDDELPWDANNEIDLLQQKIEDMMARVTASRDNCNRLIWQLEDKLKDKSNPQMIIFQDLSNARASTLDLSNETSNLLEDENQDLQNRSIRQRLSDMFWKSLPLQLFLLVGFGLASLFPKSEDQLTCALINNYGQSMELMLHYPHGPPPV